MLLASTCENTENRLKILQAVVLSSTYITLNETLKSDVLCYHVK